MLECFQHLSTFDKAMIILAVYWVLHGFAQVIEK